MLSKLANVGDDVNRLNFPLNLRNEIIPAVCLMNVVLRHPNKYLLIISARSHMLREGSGGSWRGLRVFSGGIWGMKIKHHVRVFVNVGVNSLFMHFKMQTENCSPQNNISQCLLR